MGATFAATAATFVLAEDRASIEIREGISGARPAFPVDADAVRGRPAGSPERVLLRWFRAVQRGDEATALDLTEPATIAKVGKARLIRAIHSAGALLGSPHVIETSGRQEGVVIRVVVVARSSVAYPASSPETATFALFPSETRAWRLSDMAYLLRVASRA